MRKRKRKKKRKKMKDILLFLEERFQSISGIKIIWGIMLESS